MDFIEKVLSLKPHQCTLVPDPPEALTSDAGWDFCENETFLKGVTEKLKNQGVRVSLFLDPFSFDENQKESLKRIKPDRIELYTEAYAKDFGTERQKQTTQKYADVTEQVTQLGMGVNAGHDLNLKNLKFLIRSIPSIQEVSIGHALIVESLLSGFSQTIESYVHLLHSENQR